MKLSLTLRNTKRLSELLRVPYLTLYIIVNNDPKINRVFEKLLLFTGSASVTGSFCLLKYGRLRQL